MHDGYWVTHIQLATFLVRLVRRVQVDYPSVLVKHIRVQEYVAQSNRKCQGTQQMRFMSRVEQKSGGATKILLYHSAVSNEQR